MRAHWRFLVLGQVVQHVAQFMRTAPLHRVLAAEHGIDRRSQSLGAIDHEEPLLLETHSTSHQVFQ